MRTSWKVASVAVLLVLGVSLGYGWGNATHVWFADKLGVRFGPLNQNEMYGAVLPDLFGYEFTNQKALAADFGLHTAGQIFWALYLSASTPEERACFYGMFTHSNAPDIKGADWYAHGPYPGDLTGWVNQQGMELAVLPDVYGYVSALVNYDQQAIDNFLPVVGHTLIETAVDILVKRNEDPFVGVKLYLAARNRSDEVPSVLARVIAKADPSFPSVGYTTKREAAYREEMMQYGQLFVMKESDIIAVLSQQTALVAQAYLQAIGVNPSSPVDPARIADFIGIAINQVSSAYHNELVSVLGQVKTNLGAIGLQSAGPVFASSGNESLQEYLAEVSPVTPTEFSLDQNYPNPFNPTTTIAFALPSDQLVTLKVYNAIGQEVATLVNEFRTAGRYHAVWDAKGVPSGVYFYRLQARPTMDGQAGNIVDTKKMTLLK